MSRVPALSSCLKTRRDGRSFFPRHKSDVETLAFPIVPVKKKKMMKSSLLSMCEKKCRKHPRACRFLDRSGLPLEQTRYASACCAGHIRECFVPYRSQNVSCFLPSNIVSPVMALVRLQVWLNEVTISGLLRRTDCSGYCGF